MIFMRFRGPQALNDTYKKNIGGVVLSWLTRNPFGVRQLAAAFPASKSDSHGGWLPPAPARRLDFQLSTFNFQLSTFNFRSTRIPSARHRKAPEHPVSSRHPRADARWRGLPPAIGPTDSRPCGPGPRAAGGPDGRVENGRCLRIHSAACLPNHRCSPVAGFAG